MEEDFEKKIKDLEENLKHAEEITKSITLQCDQCKFTTTRKHPETTSESDPITCDMCAVEFKSKRDLKLHMITHTFKCETCDFTEKDGWTIDIQYGKCHGKQEGIRRR